MTKVYYGRDLIGRFTCDGKNYTRFQLFVLKVKRTVKLSFLTAGAFSALGWAVVLGGHISPAQIVFAKQEVIKEVKGKAPVMERIAKCESGNSHIDPKTGQVYMLANTNKTVDVGKYMINTVWHKKAKELGLDITKEVDNEKMAYYIYENIGTSPWSASSHCWSR